MATVLIVILVIVILFVAINIYNFIRLKKAPAVAENPKITHLTATTFNQYIKSGIAVVDFWAEWCMPCKIMMPILNELASDNTLPIKVFKVNVDQQRSLAAKFNIKGIPTLIIFKNGKEVKRLVGAKTKDLIVQEIKKLSI
ncbi:MAG: thioredoxin [Bacteroidales bacterium]